MKKIFTNKFIKRHLIVVGVFIVYFLILHLLGWSCPIKDIFDIPCPTCGTTRSLISLMLLDFKGYLFYQPAGVSVLICLLLFVNSDYLIKKIRPIYFYSFLYLNIAFIVIVYIVRMINQTIYF
ncbi:MAG TPA: DUF2752 domain-containing protein [Acholeplasmataceae bacterium]|nr:DUF2752 domain-containing protein [Acholeplasmataceae bacterium]